MLLSMKVRLTVPWALLALVGPMNPVEAVTITNHLSDAWSQYELAVNVGDTILWVNEQALWLASNYSTVLALRSDRESSGGISPGRPKGDNNCRRKALGP